MEKYRFIFSLLMLVVLFRKFSSIKATATVNQTRMLKLTERNFQIDFLNEVRNNAEHMALQQLNDLLQQLKPNTKNPTYAAALEQATQTHELPAKVLFIKQYLDVENLRDADNNNNNNNANDDDDDDDDDAELEMIALRNVNFLEKLDKQLRKLQDASIKDLRQFRMFELCKQFREKSAGVLMTTFKPPYAIRHTKLVPIDEQNVDEALKKLNITNGEHFAPIELKNFGRILYGRVNVASAEIADDYLNLLRKLLEEVIGDKHAHEQDSSKLKKLLEEIDIILQTSDFYQKRQKLYAYLEQNLAADYERFKASEHAQEDLAEILNKLRERGLDLFVTFLFSNFEFLELLHKELAQLLPPRKLLANGNAAPIGDEATRLLYDVQSSYIDFKRDSENNEKYDAYLVPVKALYALTSNSGDDAHIFELLHNASLNVGSVTFNMIRAKCDEI